MKKVLSIILSIMLLATVLSGCSKKPTEKVDSGKTQTEATPTTAAKDDPTKAPDTNDTEIDISKPVTLKWFLNGSNVTDDKAALEKVNEYLKEKLNVTLEPIWGTWGDFDTNAVLAINGGDDVDIYFTSSWSVGEYNAFAKKGAWLRLDKEDNDLIEKYAKETWGLLPKVLTDGAKVNGADGVGVYGVPGYKDIATQNCWDVNVTSLIK